MSTLAAQRVVAQVCFGEEPSTQAAVRAHRLSEEDAEALAGQEAQLGVYRRLLRANVEGVMRAVCPIAWGAMCTAHADDVSAMLTAFLSDPGPRTHALRDVPREFFSWARARWEGRLPLVLIERADFECLEFEVGASPARAPEGPYKALALDATLVFREPLALAAFEHAVHEPDAPRRKVRLALFRDEEHQVQTIELDAFGFALLEASRQATLINALETACLGCAILFDGEARARAAKLLADWAASGLLLGSLSTSTRDS